MSPDFERVISSHPQGAGVIEVPPSPVAPYTSPKESPKTMTPLSPEQKAQGAAAIIEGQKHQELLQDIDRAFEAMQHEPAAPSGSQEITETPAEAAINTTKAIGKGALLGIGEAVTAVGGAAVLAPKIPTSADLQRELTQPRPAIVEHIGAYDANAPIKTPKGDLVIPSTAVPKPTDFRGPDGGPPPQKQNISAAQIAGAMKDTAAPPIPFLKETLQTSSAEITGATVAHLKYPDAAVIVNASAGVANGEGLLKLPKDIAITFSNVSLDAKGNIVTQFDPKGELSQQIQAVSPIAAAVHAAGGKADLVVAVNAPNGLITLKGLNQDAVATAMLVLEGDTPLPVNKGEMHTFPAGTGFTDKGYSEPVTYNGEKTKTTIIKVTDQLRTAVSTYQFDGQQLSIPKDAVWMNGQVTKDGTIVLLNGVLNGKGTAFPFVPLEGQKHATPVPGKPPTPVVTESQQEAQAKQAVLVGEKLSAEQLQADKMLDGITFTPTGAKSAWIVETDMPGLNQRGVDMKDLAVRIQRLQTEGVLTSDKIQKFQIIQEDNKWIEGSFGHEALKGGAPGRQFVIDDSDPNTVVFKIYLNSQLFKETENPPKLLPPEYTYAKQRSVNRWCSSSILIALAAKYNSVIAPMAGRGDIDTPVSSMAYTKDEMKNGISDFIYATYKTP